MIDIREIRDLLTEEVRKGEDIPICVTVGFDWQDGHFKTLDRYAIVDHDEADLIDQRKYGADRVLHVSQNAPFVSAKRFLESIRGFREDKALCVRGIQVREDRQRIKPDSIYQVSKVYFMPKRYFIELYAEPY